VPSGEKPAARTSSSCPRRTSSSLPLACPTPAPCCPTIRHDPRAIRREGKVPNRIFVAAQNQQLRPARRRFSSSSIALSRMAPDALWLRRTIRRAPSPGEGVPLTVAASIELR
jgi:hypothetical protein